MPKTKRDDTFDLGDDARVEGVFQVLGGNARGQLNSIIERVERLNEDKAAVMVDIKEVLAEAKGNGFDVKILRKVIAIRKQDKAKRQEEEALLDLYLSATGDDL